MSRKYQIGFLNHASTVVALFMAGKSQQVAFNAEGQGVVEASEADVANYERLGYTFSTEITIGERSKYDGVVGASQGVRAHMENLEVRNGELVEEKRRLETLTSDQKGRLAEYQQREAAYEKSVAAFEAKVAELEASYSLERRRADQFELATADEKRNHEITSKRLESCRVELEAAKTKIVEQERVNQTLQMELEHATAPNVGPESK